MQRVINTRALILQGGFGDEFYMHVYDGWLTSSSITGPWTQAIAGAVREENGRRLRSSSRRPARSTCSTADPKANPKPSLANGVPTIYTSQVPTELIVFKGQPDFVPIVGTQLLWASNTTSDVLIDTAEQSLLRAARRPLVHVPPALTGPWTFVASDALPPDFAQDSAAHRSPGAVLPTVAGTPQAQDAVIENSIPQTATVPLKNGPKFTPNFDGPPQYRRRCRERRCRTSATRRCR